MKFCVSKIRLPAGTNASLIFKRCCIVPDRARRMPVRTRGALHVHSTLSRDGTMTIAELARYFKQKCYQFLAMGEHAEDLDEAKVHALREQSATNSDDQFCVIPGIEF